ncbi:cytidine deaminase [Streptobacillus moniliformis]|uniref:Cytidine deaminase n=1 Tax=Streptobacillus moniliformis (strain ATCC 14647 / DSM 12112 / NCTC 10651 / 9901) TaxID=519441 RepID=D1AXG5_STRM9|nr:cytidine deaminase [Streptobacillus moniliformis]ACZ00991.1 cytidine deaminase [Streptobacillus moniliformis DSM 12112]AVL42633.1 cytidine deaminase [Streptobacillus moniliformis]QXW65782.1 cytidine deaminase [Streptobacillus moniliformis]SQA13870.1 Cytidine deaminase [Streptobacillus moniliformis]
MNRYSEQEIRKYIEKANNLLDRSYSPYSKYKVAAVMIDSEGNLHEGVNVENASYGLTICAERNAIASSITKGMKKIDLIVITGDVDNPISPCGMCRQVIREFSKKDTLIVLASSRSKEYILWTVEEMIPYSFGPEDLNK